MDRKDFARALAQHSLPQVMLFEGEEEQQKQDALAELRRAVLPSGMETLNETVLEDPSADQLIAFCEAPQPRVSSFCPTSICDQPRSWRRLRRIFHSSIFLTSVTRVP